MCYEARMHWSEEDELNMLSAKRDALKERLERIERHIAALKQAMGQKVASA